MPEQPRSVERPSELASGLTDLLCALRSGPIATTLSDEIAGDTWKPAPRRLAQFFVLPVFNFLDYFRFLVLLPRLLPLFLPGRMGANSYFLPCVVGKRR